MSAAIGPCDIPKYRLEASSPQTSARSHARMAKSRLPTNHGIICYCTWVGPASDLILCLKVGPHLLVWTKKDEQRGYVRCRTDIGCSVYYELKLQRQLSIEHVMYYNTTSFQHSDRWNSAWFSARISDRWKVSWSNRVNVTAARHLWDSWLGCVCVCVYVCMYVCMYVRT